MAFLGGASCPPAVRPGGPGRRRDERGQRLLKFRGVRLVEVDGVGGVAKRELDGTATAIGDLRLIQVVDEYSHYAFSHVTFFSPAPHAAILSLPSAVAPLCEHRHPRRHIARKSASRSSVPGIATQHE